LSWGVVPAWAVPQAAEPAATSATTPAAARPLRWAMRLLLMADSLDAAEDRSGSVFELTRC
jgi:hypothetical protein